MIIHTIKIQPAYHISIYDEQAYGVKKPHVKIRFASNVSNLEITPDAAEMIGKALIETAQRVRETGAY